MGSTNEALQEAIVTPRQLDIRSADHLQPDQLQQIITRLRHNGWLLFRGFDIPDLTEFASFARALGGDLLPYTERSSPRKALKDGVYTSTEYERDEWIPFHNENSYQQTWPMFLFFYCQQEPQGGGATPLADIRRVTSLIDDDVIDEFQQRGWQHVRHYHPGFGLRWQEVFGTEDRSVVDQYCAQNEIQTEWGSGDQLRTTAVRRAIHQHPDLETALWFNHIAFFHWSSMPSKASAFLLELFGRSRLPNDTRYGDGEEISAETCQHIRQAYQAASVRFDWKTGDLLMVDNMLTAHAREPYRGERRIAVAMSGIHAVV